MKKLGILILLLSGFILHGFGQQLAAFNDNLQKFWAFDGGTFQQLEYLEIQDYQVGGYLIAYIDNGSRLKMYRNGEIKTLLTGAPIKYTATDYLLGYSLYEQLNVYDNGQAIVLSTQCDGYEVRDSLIGWHNRIQQTIQIYYDGNIYTIEDGLIYNPLDSYRMGVNTAVYVQSSTQQLKLFYQGEIIILDDFVEDISYEAGRDIVAFIDSPDQSFNVFYKGEILSVETFKPKSYKVGDEILAYVDNLGRLKYFNNGMVKEVSTYEPQFYDVVDNVLVFEEQGFLKTVCNDELYIIERYIPQPYIIDWNTVAYLDENSFVKIFQNCESKAITFEKVNEINVIRDLVIFVEGINKTKIYFMGQIFEK
jgi:hypothetical protein